MNKLYSGDTINIDDEYQQSVEYQDDKAQWASEQGFPHCDLCGHDFENDNDFNEHLCCKE